MTKNLPLFRRNLKVSCLTWRLLTPINRLTVRMLHIIEILYTVSMWIRHKDQGQWRSLEGAPTDTYATSRLLRLWRLRFIRRLHFVVHRLLRLLHCFGRHALLAGTAKHTCNQFYSQRSVPITYSPNINCKMQDGWQSKLVVFVLSTRYTSARVQEPN